jgi:hypothetical protein
LEREAAPAEPKRPLFRTLPNPEPFPLQALCELREAAEAICTLTQAPEAMCAQSVLAAATLAAQPHVNVVLPSGTRPLTEYFLTVAESGERKSTVDRLALRSVHEMEEHLRTNADAVRAAFTADKTAWEAARDEARKLAKKGGRAAVREALRNLGAEPRPPASPMLLIADLTPEALVLHLAEGRPWGGVFTAEGGLLVGGAAFSDDARMRTGALLNALWDGDAIRRRRVTTGQAFLPGRRCALHVMLQPVAADRFLADDMLKGLGLLARMLVSAPQSTAGTRMWREPSEAARQAYEDYCRRLRQLLDLPVQLDGEALAPAEMVLTPDARTMWVAFHDHAEAQLGEGGVYRCVRGFGAKLAEHAGRLAAVLAFYKHGGMGRPREVDAEHMAGGIKLARYYAGEMLRLSGAAAVATELRIAQSVLDWLKERQHRSFHLTQLYQFGPAAVRTAATARTIVVILVDHGHIRPLPRGTVVDGAPRNAVWELVPD